MKLLIDRDALSDVLFRVQGVCAQKSTLPILACCLLEAHDDGRLEVHGTDLDISVSTESKANIEAPGKVAVVAKKLFDTVKMLPAGMLSLEAEPNHWAKLDAGAIKQRLAGNHPDEFPRLPDFEGTGSFELPAEVLLDMVEKIFFSISTDEARPSFMGAFLRLSEDGKLQMVSTDGHRLSKIERTLEHVDMEAIPEGLISGIIVPRKGLNEIRRVIPNEGLVYLSLKGDDLRLSHDVAAVSVRLIPGRFPNFSQVIPKESEHSIHVNREALLSALKRAANYTAKTGNTRFTAEGSMLTVHAFDAEVGEFEEPVPCTYNGSGISAGYNYQYVLDVLKVVEGDELILDIINTESPTVLRDPARPETLYIVMPMQF